MRIYPGGSLAGSQHRRPDLAANQFTPDDPEPPEQCTLRKHWHTLQDSLGLLAGGATFEYYKRRSIERERSHPPLTDVSNMRLDRPLVICPGWNTERYKFSHLAHKLEACEDNGKAVYLREGKAFADADCTRPLDIAQIPSNTKIFICQWDSIKAPPDQTAPQLAQNLNTVRTISGHERVDAMGYSMGGLVLRKYLNDGGDQVGRLLMLGTPNQGTRFGQMVTTVVDQDVDWVQRLTGVSAQDSEVMRWLGRDGDQIAELNRDWPRQRGQVEQALVVGSSVEWTPSGRVVPFRRGDSMVEPRDLALPGVPVQVLRDSPYLHHGSLPHDSKVFEAMADFFTWTPVSGPYVPLPPRTEETRLTGQPYSQI